MKEDGSHADNRRINQVDTGGRGRSILGGRFERGGDRGGGHGHNPYQNTPGIPNFTAEAGNYPQEIFNNSRKLRSKKLKLLTVGKMISSHAIPTQVLLLQFKPI